MSGGVVTAPNKVASDLQDGFQRGFGQGRAVFLVSAEPDLACVEFNLQVKRPQHLFGLGDDLRADAVAGQQADAVGS